MSDYKELRQLVSSNSLSTSAASRQLDSLVKSVSEQAADLQHQKLALLESFMKHTLVKRNLTGRESGCLYDDLAKSIQSKVE